ncbi:MAG: hypothetical protein A3E87_07275 [Gammaproteobacteria bacterium RIFCSPHIGHO2_12_FULL_35_23]|nr:MAG: hypothetical protein A3E87_07275 [Gammaproteobacteria bacterium RIFCSPHIGHO2_12_FULL_35_23]
MKKLLMLLILSLSVTVSIGQNQTTPINNNNDSSIIEDITLKSNQLFITTKDKTKQIITLSKEQLQSLKQKGRTGFQSLQSILDQYHLQWPVTKNTDDSSNE